MGRILVIEDEPGTQLLLQSRLHDLGHEVITSPNGAMGVMEARSNQFDLFLVDVRLGSGIDGYEVTRRLKAMPHTHGVPVVLVSNQVKSREELHKGYEAGCESFLIKGDITLLEDVVRAMLRIKSLQDDLAMQNRLLDDHNRRLQDERGRAGDGESARPAASAPRDPAQRPEAMLVVDADGVVALVDRGAREVFGKNLEGAHIGQLAPGTGIEAYVRDARTEPREGFRFDLAALGGREERRLVVAVMPLMARPGHQDRGYRVVLAYDAARRPSLDAPEGAPRRDVGPLVEAARFAFHPSSLLGISPQIGELRSTALKLAGEDGSVLLIGEPGTGRERMARALHFGANRAGPFVLFGCASIAPERVEAELFGQAKGPGVEVERPGLFHQAHRGTLYLYDVHALPADVQQRLIEYFTTGKIRRAGGKREEKVKVRLVSSSGRELEQQVELGRFSGELQRLLSATTLKMPTLRERIEDVPVLAQYFLARSGAALGTPEFSDNALWVLENHLWPGNVRELEHAIERACANAKDPVIDVEQLPQALRDLQGKLISQDQIAPQRPRVERISGTHLPPRFIAGQPPAQAQPAGKDEEVSLEYYERMGLLKALDHTKGDKLAAARLLKIGKSTLYRKLKRYDIK
jgi:DNA-binding NtrC family response regulator